MNKFQNSKIQSSTPRIIILKLNRKTETITCFCVPVSLKKSILKIKTPQIPSHQVTC